MRIGFSGIDLPEGKVKYADHKLAQLVEKCNPKKTSPFYVEFVPDEFLKVDVIAITEDKLLDLLILDMDKCERKIEENADEKPLMLKCMELLEKELPVCEGNLTSEEKTILQSFGFASLKPVVRFDDTEVVNEVIKKCLAKSATIFFYTAGEKEVKAWAVKQGSDMITCAGKIHSDFARGFIKGDVAGFDDFLQSHNFNDCRKKGLVKVVDKDYIINSHDIIEIRFNV